MIRDSLDPFSVGDRTGAGTRADERSWTVAQSISTRVGPEAPVIGRYLSWLAWAPPNHLELLRRRGARILFAPTIPDGLASTWADKRRGRSLSAVELLDLRTKYSPEAETAGIYDPRLDVLVLPTSYVARDVERVVLHELGHALTMAAANVRPSLLEDLPAAIARHVDRLTVDDPSTSLRVRVFEALAEAYAYLVVGQADQLPSPIVSELMFILTTVADEDDHIRFDFDADTERTTTRVERSEMIFSEDAEARELLAERPGPRDELEVADLAVDELALRRWRRRAA